MTARRAIQALHLSRPALVARPAVPTMATAARHYSSAGPYTVVDRGFWKSLVPKPLRKENRQALKQYGKQWNPATFFIVIFLLIGSMSIQMITLRNSFDRYMRISQVRIGLLREVVERIQNGEKVDVEKLLGTGDEEKEADWEEGEDCYANAEPRIHGKLTPAHSTAIIREGGQEQEDAEKGGRCLDPTRTYRAYQDHEPRKRPTSAREDTAQKACKLGQLFLDYFHSITNLAMYNTTLQYKRACADSGKHVFENA